MITKSTVVVHSGTLAVPYENAPIAGVEGTLVIKVICVRDSIGEFRGKGSGKYIVRRWECLVLREIPGSRAMPGCSVKAKHLNSCL